MSLPKADDDRGWIQFLGLLPSNRNDLAKEQGMIFVGHPKGLKAKFEDLDTLLRALFAYVVFGSLQDTATLLAAKGIVEISKVGLHLRLASSVPMLRALLQGLLEEHWSQTDWARVKDRWAVRIVDATVVLRPGAKGTTARVHYVIDLPALRLQEVRVTDDSEGETLLHFEPKEDELYLLDRGYSNANNLVHAKEARAKVICRYNRQAMPLWAGEHKVDLKARLDQLTEVWEQREWTGLKVRNEAGKEVRVRLCAMKLPEHLAQEACTRHKREHGALTEEQAYFCQFVVLVTTLTVREMSLQDVFELYRMRWQIELYIKRDKSLGDLDELPCRKPESIQGWLYTKLVLTQLVYKLAAREAAFSPAAYS